MRSNTACCVLAHLRRRSIAGRATRIASQANLGPACLIARALLPGESPARSLRVLFFAAGHNNVQSRVTRPPRNGSHTA
jgi:hypothetical protein